MKHLLPLFAIALIISSCSPLKKIQVKSADDMMLELYSVKRADKEVKEGLYVQYYNNVKSVEGTYTNNKKEGLWQYYDYNHKVNFSGNYENDLKIGKWTYYHIGKLCSEMYYSKGEPDSAKGYHKNGTIAYRAQYNPDKTGYCRSYHPNGKPKEVIFLKNSKIDGICTIYFENGQLFREIEYAEGKRMSVLKTFDKNGKEIDGGTLKQGDGTYITFHLPEKPTDTALKIHAIKTYQGGKLNGPGKFMRKNGNLSTEGLYKDGSAVGNWKLYNEDGTFKSTANYEKDIYKNVKSLEPDVFHTSNEVDDITNEPEFPGGESERASFLKKNIRYPKEARAKKVEGTVYVNFIISQTGELESFKIVKGVNEQLDNEVIKMLKTMPRWSPGLEHGVPVRVAFNMPVKYSIK